MTQTQRVLCVVAVTLFGACSVLAASEKPSFDIDWYGSVKLDASYDQDLTSHGNYVMWVQSQEGVDNDEQFNMTHKETRFGIVTTGKGYHNAIVGGKLEFDMYGGDATENQALLLLRHAYFTVESGQFGFLAGQTEDLFSPLLPSTLNYGVLWNSGNLGYRRPQVRLSYTIEPSDQTNVLLAGGAFRTIGDDLTPTLSLAADAAGEESDESDDGTDAGIPSFQGLLELNHNFPSGATLRMGVSGLYGQLKAEGTLGTSETYKSQAVVGHVEVVVSPNFGFSGEYFTGSNLANYLGGIDNGNTLDGVATKGGWGSVWTNLTNKVKLTAGGGLDDPDDADISSGSRSKNQSYFGSLQFTPIPLFTIGAEVSQWKTWYKDGDASETLRVQSSFVLNF